MKTMQWLVLHVHLTELWSGQILPDIGATYLIILFLNVSLKAFLEEINI